MRQEAMKTVCRDILGGIDNALGCAVVDLGTGLALALDVQPGSAFTAEALEMLAAGSVSYFQDRRADPDADTVRDIQTATDDAYHFMSLVPGRSRELFVLVTDRQRGNLGLGWLAMRGALAQVADADGGTLPGRAAGGDPDAGDEHVFDMRSRGRRSIWD